MLGTKLACALEPLFQLLGQLPGASLCMIHFLLGHECGKAYLPARVQSQVYGPRPAGMIALLCVELIPVQRLPSTVDSSGADSDEAQDYQGSCLSFATEMAQSNNSEELRLSQLDG